MSFRIDYNELKLTALEEATSYPAYKELKDIPLIEIDDFNFEIIKEKISSNDLNITSEGIHMDLIFEIIRLLNDNKKRFHIDQHNYIGLYWRGLPMIIIKVIKDSIFIPPNRMMYISIKVFKDELKNAIVEKKLNRIVIGGFGGLLIIGGLITGLIFYKNN